MATRQAKGCLERLQEIRDSAIRWVGEYDKGTEMNLDELVPSTSKYLAKEDVGIAGKNLTIDRFTRETVGNGADADERAVIHWREDYKPMVLNKTNKNRIKAILQATTAEEVVGKNINAYNDPMIEYAGEITGGLRLREAQAVAAPDALTDDPSDDIPF